MLLAFSYFGEREKPGKESNKKISEFIKKWAKKEIDDSDIAWCSIFVNEINKESGLGYTNKLNARSWLELGEKIDLKEIKFGDIVILWRESVNSWKGHVGYFVNKNENELFILGGNQNNAVNIQAYNINRLLGIRRIT